MRRINQMLKDAVAAGACEIEEAAAILGIMNWLHGREDEEIVKILPGYIEGAGLEMLDVEIA